MKKSVFFKTLILLIAIIVIAAFVYNRMSKSIDTPSPLQQPDSTVSSKQESPQEENTSTSSEDSQPEKYPAADFEMLDNEGNTVNFSDYIGKPIVINFWASWCGPCIIEMPYFQSAFEQYGEDEIQFLMVNLTSGRETVEIAKEFIDENEFTFPIFFDSRQQAAEAYAISSIPLTVFIDSKGNIVTYAKGSLREEDLSKGIDLLFQNEETIKAA